MMINKISRMSEIKDGTKFRITSLKPIEPENASDPFEREVLEKFEHRSEGDFYRLERRKSRDTVFR